MTSSTSDPQPGLVEICRHSAQLVDRYLASDAADPTRQSAQRQVRLSISIIEKLLETHSFDEIALSFNGGKDCLVMLVIFQATLYYAYDKSGHVNPPLGERSNIPSVYVQSENTFAEVESFVDKCSVKYGLNTLRLLYPLKSAFGTYLEHYPHIKTILVGIRRADPYGEKLDYIQRTDHGWPDFVRAHPVLEWHFIEVWDFLRYLEIPYCVLYDRGYTSLGGTNNTAKNPYLATGETDVNGDRIYRPAYHLTDDDKERLGRQ